MCLLEHNLDGTMYSDIDTFNQICPMEIITNLINWIAIRYKQASFHTEVEVPATVTVSLLWFLHLDLESRLWI